MATSAEKLGPPWTVLKLLEWSKGFFEARGIDSPRLDAEILLAHVLDVGRVRLYTEFDRPLMPEELAQYRALVKRRANREPVAYLVGSRGFWTLDIATDSRALVPRPDTEILVEEALAKLGESGRVLDVGTGTGAVALAIVSERPGCSVHASDISVDALALAAENAAQLELTVEFHQSDLLEGVEGEFDMIVSNPPYVADGAEVDPETQREPQSALFAGPDGLDVIRRLIPAAARQLVPGGWLMIEMGYDQASAVEKLFTEGGFDEVGVRKDYGGNDRVVRGRKG